MIFNGCVNGFGGGIETTSVSFSPIHYDVDTAIYYTNRDMEPLSSMEFPFNDAVPTGTLFVCENITMTGLTNGLVTSGLQELSRTVIQQSGFAPEDKYIVIYKVI